MAWGGARPGAGRKKKALNDKILEGNPGKRKIKIVTFETDSFQLENPPSFLAQNGIEGAEDVPSATEIYQMVAEFVEKSGCGHLIAPLLIEDFAHLRRSYLECEYINRTKGRIANGKRSPYVTMAIDYSKQAMAIFDRIWNTLAQNSEQPYEGKNEFLSMLTNRGF